MAPELIAVELLITAWCTCWDKQSINQDKLDVINYLRQSAVAVAVDFGFAQVKTAEFRIEALTAEAQQFGG